MERVVKNLGLIMAVTGGLILLTAGDSVVELGFALVKSLLD